uniref:GIY-YIG domain-containing protein n=1 Tax=Leersia perrieri TaxID=77586 RepID=A0A0D9XP05_9ORYZ
MSNELCSHSGTAHWPIRPKCPKRPTAWYSSNNHPNWKFPKSSSPATARWAMKLSATFRSTKIPRALPPKSGDTAAASGASASCAAVRPSAETAKGKGASGWCVYLIASSRIPRTYVGVTTDFPRRLRQHNGELKGGAKASSAGRPWNLACLIEGFVNRSKACEFESKWKNISRKMARKRTEPSMSSLLQHRDVALSKVKTHLDCRHLKIAWHSS